MKENIKYVKNKFKDNNFNIDFLSKEEVLKAKNFHSSFPQYKETPLVQLNNLANYCGINGIYVKDESYRFGLNAFKVLGGSYAIAKYICEKLQTDITHIDYNKLISNEVGSKLGDLTFVTATDGNHGRGVAWTANQLKQKSVVYMPKGSSKFRLENIKGEGAEAYITDMNYDDAVRLASKNANEKGWVVIQDTSWDNYVKIPTWIMQGYGTMALEIVSQLENYKDKPTHVFIQAGVGSLAGAIQGVFASIYSSNPPIVVIVESNKADCLYESANEESGSIVTVSGDMNTIMAGLACGEPNTIGWEVLKHYSSYFVSCPDWIAAKGMRVLGNSLKEDRKIISGESGAVTTGLLVEILTNNDYSYLKSELQLDENSVVLLFSTEGDTDPENYKEIVWNGKCNS